jgi:hypothetical protein
MTSVFTPTNGRSWNQNHPLLSIRATAILTLLATSSLIAGCVGSVSGTPATKAAPVPTVASVMVSCTPATVTLGATTACTAVVSGTNNESQAVTWTATNGTVTSAGVFTPNATGTAVVTATSAQDVSKSGTASVTVKQAAPTVTSVAVSCSPTTISLGATAACSAVVSGINSPSQAVTWTATNGSVSPAGVFTPSAAGTAVVTATSVQDATKSGFANVTITAPLPTVTSVTVSCVPATVVLGASTACSAVVNGTGNPSQAVTWTSPNGAVTTAGGFTPSALGTAVITATSVEDTTKSGNFSETVTSATIDFGTGQGPTLIVDANGSVDLSWVLTGSAGNVIFGRSIDGGATFTTALVTQPGSVGLVGMGVDGQGVVSLLWETGTARAIFGNSTDGGKTFVQTDISSLVGIGTAETFAPQLVVSANGLIDVSQIASLPVGDGRGVFSTVLINNGMQADPTVEIASNVKDGDDESVAATGAQGQIYVAWQMGSDAVPECKIMFSASLDGGMTFSTPLNVSNNPGECGEFPQLFIDATGAVNIAWTTIPGFEDDVGPLTNPNELYFARSTDQGTTFSTPVALVGINQYTGMGDDYSGVGDPQIAVESNGDIDVVFDANTATDTIALFARSTDGGTTFSTPLTLGTGGANSPTIAIDSCGGIDVVWAGSSDIFFSRSADGLTFETPMNVSNARTSEFSPLIATSAGGAAYVVWENTTDVFFQAIKVCQ